MARETISFATCNLFNLNEASLPIYTDKDGWDQEQYDKKIAWIAQVLRTVPSDVYGFQELWHAQSLTNAFAAAGLLDAYDLLVPPGHASLGTTRRSIPSTPRRSAARSRPSAGRRRPPRSVSCSRRR